MNGHIYRYPTFIKNQKSYDIYIGLGAGHTGYTIHTKNINFPLTVSDIIQTNKETIITRDITAHNFTVFKSKYKDILYGIGGLLRDQEPWGQTELDKNSGVYLFKNINNRWDKKSTPIISSYNCPKNAIISIEKKAPEFGSYFWRQIWSLTFDTHQSARASAKTLTCVGKLRVLHGAPHRTLLPRTKRGTRI